jgi:hypothetical protein
MQATIDLSSYQQDLTMVLTPISQQHQDVGDDCCARAAKVSLRFEHFQSESQFWGLRPINSARKSESPREGEIYTALIDRISPNAGIERLSLTEVTDKPKAQMKVPHLPLRVCIYVQDSGFRTHQDKVLCVLRLEQPIGATRVVLESEPHASAHRRYMVSPAVPRHGQSWEDRLDSVSSGALSQDRNLLTLITYRALSRGRRTRLQCTIEYAGF